MCTVYPHLACYLNNYQGSNYELFKLLVLNNKKQAHEGVLRLKLITFLIIVDNVDLLQSDRLADDQADALCA